MSRRGWASRGTPAPTRRWRCAALTASTTPRSRPTSTPAGSSPGRPGSFPSSTAPRPQSPPGAVLPARDVTVRPGRAGFYNQFFDVSRLNGYPSELENPRTEMATLGAERELFTGWDLSLHRAAP